MKSLSQYINEQRQIQLLGDTKFNQFVVMAGGAASGKGYVQDRINADFKTLDVDKLKIMYAKAYPKDGGKTITKDGKFIVGGWDFSNSKDVGELHELVKNIGWKPLQRKLAKLAGTTAQSNRLPNILLDITGKSIKDIKDALTLASTGYNKTLVWVVQSIDTAKEQNKTRSRTVPEEILLDTHNESYKAVLDYVLNDQEVQFDNVWVYLSYNPKYIEIKPEELKNRAFKLDKVGNKFEITQELINKIDDLRKRKIKR